MGELRNAPTAWKGFIVYLCYAPYGAVGKNYCVNYGMYVP